MAAHASSLVMGQPADCRTTEEVARAAAYGWQCVGAMASA
jgi:hypothetical protein